MGEPIKLGDCITEYDAEAIDAVARTLSLLAKYTGCHAVHLEVMVDGRCEIRGIAPYGNLSWQARGDVHPDVKDLPSKALRSVVAPAERGGRRG